MDEGAPRTDGRSSPEHLPVERTRAAALGSLLYQRRFRLAGSCGFTPSAGREVPSSKMLEAGLR